MKRRTALEVLAAGVGAGQLGIAQHHLVTLAQELTQLEEEVRTT